jgi:hypothetical protein
VPVVKYRAFLACVLFGGFASGQEIPPDATLYPGYVAFGMSKAQAIAKVRKYHPGLVLRSTRRVVTFEAPASTGNHLRWSFSFKAGKLVESSETILDVIEVRCRHIVESYRNLSKSWPSDKLRDIVEAQVVSEDDDTQRFVYSTPDAYIEVSRTAPGRSGGLCDVTRRFIEPSEWRKERNVASGT